MAESTLDAPQSASKTDRPNKVQITDVGPSRKKIVIEIPAETVAEQLGTSLDTLMVEAELPGFRKGRAPRRLIEKRFGTAVRKEAKDQLIAQAYSKAIEEHKLRVIGEPIGADVEKVEVQDGKPLAFEVEVEVPPEFELASLDGIAVRRPMFEVTDAMVDEQIDKLKLQEGRLESRPEPEPGDYLTGHGRVLGPDGTAFIDIADAVIQIPAGKDGKGMILGIKVDDFGAQLGLPPIGQTAVVKAVGPESHEIEALRGLDLRIEFTVSRIDRIIPASDDEIVARFGFSDAGQLRDTIRARMQERIAIDQAAAMREQIARHLLDAVAMELPERMTKGQTERVLARQRLELMHRGADPQAIEENIAELRAASGQVAARELKLFFILDKAAETLDVRVTEGEINARIAQMAMASNERPEKLRAELIARNQVGSVYQQVREHKTMDAILAKATVTDTPVDEFNALMAEEAKKRGEPAKPAAKKPSTKKAAAKEEKKEDKDDEGEAKAEKKPAKKPAAKKSGK